MFLDGHKMEMQIYMLEQVQEIKPLVPVIFLLVAMLVQCLMQLVVY